MSNAADLLSALQELHGLLRDAIVDACEAQAAGDLREVADDGPGDTIYAIDRVSEERLVDFINERIATRAPVVLVAEGVAGGRCVLPEGADDRDARWRIIVDPIDGTRGLMYQKRPGWILTGVAPELGDRTRLSDIELALMTEIPLIKQHLSDQAWATRGRGAEARRYNRLTDEHAPLSFAPSRADTPAHGYAMLSRFFPGGRDRLAAIDDAVVSAALPEAAEGKALCFEDQYASTGGQLWELASGRDRFNADLRPLLAPYIGRRPLCCHPYDLAAMLVAEEAGVILTDPAGNPLDAPLETEADVAWVGYANEALQARMEPALRAALLDQELLPA